MCSSLATQNYDVSLVVADGLGDEFRDGVNIKDTGTKSGGRLSRMTKTVRRVYQKALELDADVYHLHDPELIPVGLKLKKRGKKVIFDSHEDLPKQLLAKPYLNCITKFVLSNAFALYERWACPKFDAIVTATPFIRDKFLTTNNNTVDINNFPLLEELANTVTWADKRNEVVYVGGIEKIRGIEQVVEALDLIDGVRLNLAGKFSEKAIEDKVKAFKGWGKVNELGFLNRAEISNILAKSKVGLVTLHPVINYRDALPVKMFEYMAAGIPVVASNFPLWCGIIEGAKCGVCVDPMNSQSIADTILYLMENPAGAEKMGRNGRQAVEKNYNWLIEKKKLFKLYEELLI